MVLLVKFKKEHEQEVEYLENKHQQHISVLDIIHQERLNELKFGYEEEIKDKDRVIKQQEMNVPRMVCIIDGLRDNKTKYTLDPGYTL